MANNQTVNIEEVDYDKKSAKINGEWEPIGGKAAQYIKYLKAGEAEVGRSQEGTITYARNTGSKPEKSSGGSGNWKSNSEYNAKKDARITRQWAVREALSLLRLWAEQGGGSMMHTKETTTAQHTWTNKKELFEDVMNTADALENAIQTRETRH